MFAVRARDAPGSGISAGQRLGILRSSRCCSLVAGRLVHVAASDGVVQGSHLGLEIDVSTFRMVQLNKILLDVQRCILDILGCSEMFYTLFASRLFSRPCATPRTPQAVPRRAVAARGRARAPAGARAQRGVGLRVRSPLALGGELRRAAQPGPCRVLSGCACC